MNLERITENNIDYAVSIQAELFPGESARANYEESLENSSDYEYFLISVTTEPAQASSVSTAIPKIPTAPGSGGSVSGKAAGESTLAPLRSGCSKIWRLPGDTGSRGSIRTP